MDHRVYNFSAGPGMLPVPVLEEIQEELLNYRGYGMSVMELSHRSPVFEEILNHAEQDLCTLLSLPSNYKILFLQGGATLQFSMIPMNLALNGAADYILTGTWSKKAFLEGRKFCDAKIAASSEPEEFSCLPDCTDLPIREETQYIYLCENETIHGNQFPKLPDCKGKILVSDQSSMFLSKPCRVSDYGVILAGVQKNVGPAGLAIVILREDLIPRVKDTHLPAYLQYRIHEEAHSLYNTPNCWAIYVCGKVFRYLLSQGGLTAAEARNREKAGILYNFLDTSGLFRGYASKSCRSMMNVTFHGPGPEWDSRFLAYAEKEGLVNLKGHRSVGGLRASLYNAMPKAGVESLADCLREFERRYG